MTRSIVSVYNKQENLLIKGFIAVVSIVILILLGGCSILSGNKPVSRPPQTPLTAEESFQLWRGNCENAAKTGCILVRVGSKNNKPVEGVIVIVEGPGGMAGRTDANGEYRWSKLPPGKRIISITILNADSTVNFTEEREIEILTRTISDIKFQVP